LKPPASARITYIISRADTVGGAQVHVADLSQALREAGHDVSVVAGGSGPFLDLMRRRSIPVIQLDELVQPIDPRQDGRALVALRRVLRSLRPDLISTHSSKAGILGRLAARSLGIPTIFTAHGWAMADTVRQPSRFLFGASEWLAAPLAAKIVTVSFEDEQLARRWRLPGVDRLVTVQNGSHDVPRPLWADPARDPARILMVARYEEPKDHAGLLRALSDVESLWSSLDLVGSGPGERRIRQLVAQLGLSERVCFHPIPSDVPALMAQAQIYALVSTREGLPRTIIEAMRSRLPVVASNVGGIPELVEDGVTGLLARPGDVDDLRDKLATLLREPKTRYRMAQAARERYEASFTFTRLLEETVELYEAVLGTRLLRPPLCQAASA
jgi:glycosyltransferase involved in cell wall biosynthesis